MGTFSVQMEVANPVGHEFVAVTALVDTGSSYTVLGEDFLSDLGILPIGKRQFQLGDDRMVEYDMGEARLRLGDAAQVTPVVFGPSGVSPFLGAISLQIFGLVADSVNERLISMPPIQSRPF